MRRDGQKPGLMIYHGDIVTFLDSLTDEQFGALFKALLRCSIYGELPVIEDNVVQIIANSFVPKIEADNER